MRLSLPDNGLVIDNITDPNQSWIFKTSELLYFWRDPYYLDVIIVITINRSQVHSDRPYSASVFRLRSTDSTQTFIQRAQIFFANLSGSPSTSNTPKPSRKGLVEKSNRTEDQATYHNFSTNNETKTKSPLAAVGQSSPVAKITVNPNQSPQTITAIRRIARAEFDLGKRITDTNTKIGDHPTPSETASPAYSQLADLPKEVLLYTKRLNDDNDDMMIVTNTNFSSEQVADLMRELKELRNEIASLKLERRTPPVTRSMSTSPLVFEPDNSKESIDSSITTSSPSFRDITFQSEVDAQTQTDLSLISQRRRQLSRKTKTMIGSGDSSTMAIKTIRKAYTTSDRRAPSSSSINTVSDQEGKHSDLNKITFLRFMDQIH